MFSDFKIRSLTAAGLAFLCFLALFLGHFYLKLFIYFLSAILFFEWMRIISQIQWIIRGLIALVFSSFVYFTDDYTALDLLFVASKKSFEISCLLYTSPSPRDQRGAPKPASA